MDLEGENIVLIVTFLVLISLVYITGFIVWVCCRRSESSNVGVGVGGIDAHFHIARNEGGYNDGRKRYSSYFSSRRPGFEPRIRSSNKNAFFGKISDVGGFIDLIRQYQPSALDFEHSDRLVQTT